MNPQGPSKLTQLVKKVSADLSPRNTVVIAGGSPDSRQQVAEHAAHTLKATLQRHSLKPLIGKYVGETEKNLRRIFEKAESSNDILFFDEADALLGNRGEIKESNDRYAKLETAGILWKMISEYPGMLLVSLAVRETPAGCGTNSVCVHEMDD